MDKWETRMIDTKRGTFEVFVKGNGPCLCLTHHYSEFNNSGDHFAECFTKHYMVYLVNLRETGNSSKATEHFQLGMFETVLDLEAIREALGYSSWTFAGHSTGGMIGLVYGIYFSKSLDSLIVAGTAAREYYSSSDSCIYNEKHPKFLEMQNLIEQLKDKSLSPLQRNLLSEARTKLSLFQPERYTSLFPKHINKKMSAIRMNFFAREILLFDITRKLSQITVDTLIVCGKHDVQCPLPYSIEIHELIPNSRLVIFEESNRYPFLEEPLLFHKVIENFRAT